MNTLGLNSASGPDRFMHRPTPGEGRRARQRWSARAFFLLLGAVGCLMMPARQIGAMTARALSLEELTQRAGRIFVGRCIDVREAQGESGQPITEITFKIIEPIKGVSTDRIMIRQLRGPLLPGYSVGQEVLLFLHPESPTGLTSPVGFGQGIFTVLREGPRRDKAVAIGDGVRAGRRALRRALIASGKSTSDQSAITSGNTQPDDGRAIELAPLIKATRRLIGEDTR
jgi:hypothetical protein